MTKIITFFVLFMLGINTHANTILHRDSIVNYARTLIGIPYHYGGSSASGFDCSGFVYHVFKQFNQQVPRVSAAYSQFKERGSIKNCKPADVIVFTGTDPSKKKPGHVGLILKNENGIVDFIHASSSKKHYGVTITRFNSSGYVKRFLYTISVLNDNK